jgi:hypothetical protein
MNRLMVMIVTLILSSVFSAMANAAIFTGQCQLTEVEPIMEIRYVSETCSRNYECRCGTNPDGSAAPCDTCTETWECGRDQSVRVGSKPLRPILVNATLIPVKVGETAPDQVYSPATKCVAEIDKGFKPIQLAQATTQTKTGVVNAKVEIVEDRTDLLAMNLSAETVEVNPEEIKDYLKSLKIKDRNRLTFSPLQNLEYLNFIVCVSKDKRFTGNEKTFGCQSTPSGMKDGDFILTHIDLDRPARRNWIYSLNFNYNGSHHQVRRIINWK